MSCSHVAFHHSIVMSTTTFPIFELPSSCSDGYKPCHAGEASVKKTAKALDGAVDSIHQLLVDHWGPCMDHILFQFGELKGMARCSQWEEIGLKVWS